MRKPTSLQISFGISILCHVVLIGGYELFNSTGRSPALQQTDGVPTLTLVAAPDEPVVPTTPVVKVVVPVEPQDKPPERISTEPTKPPTPEPQAQPVLPASPPVAVTTPPPPPVKVIHGDASSPKPGTDTITSQAQPSVEAKPNYLKNPEPVYPDLARRRHQEGLVLLDVTVTTQGSVSQIKLKKSSGFALLDNAALQAVRDWEFEPARLGSLPLESQITVPVRFELQTHSK